MVLNEKKEEKMEERTIIPNSKLIDQRILDEIKKAHYEIEELVAEIEEDSVILQNSSLIDLQQTTLSFLESVDRMQALVKKQIKQLENLVYTKKNLN